MKVNYVKNNTVKFILCDKTKIFIERIRLLKIKMSMMGENRLLIIKRMLLPWERLDLRECF